MRLEAAIHAGSRPEIPVKSLSGAPIFEFFGHNSAMPRAELENEPDGRLAGSLRLSANTSAAQPAVLPNRLLRCPFHFQSFAGGYHR
jgi:hypothetical protein